MENNPKHDDALLVAAGGSCAVIQVKGRGSFKAGPALKKFCLDMLAKKVSQVVLDMSQCTGMDSTFMGVLAGVAMRMRAGNQGQIVMVNLTSHHADLLQTLGLDKLIGMGEESLSAAGAAQVARLTGKSRLETTGTDRRSAYETMLTAHEDLVRANADNAAEFEDVLTYLRKELDRSAAGAAI